MVSTKQKRRSFLVTLAFVLILYGFVVSIEQSAKPGPPSPEDQLVLGIITSAAIGVLVILGVMEWRAVEEPFWVIGKGVINEEAAFGNSDSPPAKPEDVNTKKQE